MLNCNKMKNLNKKNILYGISILIVGVVLGRLLFGGSKMAENGENIQSEAEQETVWTCSMHPQIRQPESGDCPICGMDLIPLNSSQGGEMDPMAISMTPTAMQLAQVETMVVGGDTDETKSMRLNGKIQADERLVQIQSSHVPGRVEKLMVNFTGDYVKEGQVIAYVYSPDLAVAQQELLEAQKIKEVQPNLFNSAKEKLKNWKLTNNQINKILTSGKPIEQFPILANTSGYVTKKMVSNGDYVKAGEPIYQISDLSKVWVLLDVYESEMQLIKKGAPVTYTVSSLAGETFKGVISYVDPVIDPMTRVAKARIEVMNKNYTFKPEMFVSGIVKNNLVSDRSTIIVPKSAVMWTGKRSVVYVMEITDQNVSFKMREVALGQELSDGFVIESGLENGEEIAVNGTFSIDAAAQLAGKPSMMSPMDSEEKPMKFISKKVAVSGDTKKALGKILENYFNLTTALSADNLDAAHTSGKNMKTALEEIKMDLFEGEAHDVWMQQSAAIRYRLKSLEKQNDLKKMRNDYMHLSNVMVALVKSFGPLNQPIYVQNCPMANENKGADWLSKEKKIMNPYFGKNMLTCGETKETLK